MINIVTINNQHLFDIANEIRNKNNDTNKYAIYQMPELIMALGLEDVEALDAGRLRSLNTSAIRVKNYAFIKYVGLTEVTLTNATSVGIMSFNACDELTTLNAPNLITIEKQAFFSCDVLKNVYLPNVETIDTSAFSYCKALAKIDLPKAATIGTTAFSNCSNLKAVILRSSIMCEVANQFATPFRSTPIANGSGYIYVPRALLSLYQGDANWADYSNQFRAIEDYPDICG